MRSQEGSSYVLEVDGLSIVVTRKRVKNVNFRFDAQGRPAMSVPWGMSKVRAAEVAKRHADWFRAHEERMRQRAAISPAQWSTGDKLRVWGTVRTLRVCEGTDALGCLLEEDELVLCVPVGSTPTGRQGIVERWLADELRARLRVVRPKCEELTGLRARSITLRRMKTRWGSCTSSTGRIRLNTALAECPPECLEMVLIHELCHLREPNHGPRFHALMDLYCPSWRVYQRWLDEHAPRA